MASIVCSDPVHSSFVEVCERRGHSVIRPQSARFTDDELRAHLASADGLVVRSATTVGDDLLSCGPSLRVVGRAGAGLDNVDVHAATRRNIPVINTPFGPTVSAAEHTIALISTLARGMFPSSPTAAAAPAAPTADLHGRVLGVVGLGRIGREVAAFCKAAGMHVLAFDPVLSEAVTRDAGVEQVSLDTIYRVADIITVHTPLTRDTQGMIGRAQLAKCKPGVLIVNCARGGIVDEDALLEGLESGHVGGAALDVYRCEPPPASLAPLLNHPRVLCTPHLGASTHEAQHKIATELALRVCDAIEGRRVRGAVNTPVAEGVPQRDLVPFVALAEKLGSLQAQLGTGRVETVTVSTSGRRLGAADVADLITRAALKGVLSHVLEEEVNVMNAPALAEELGLRVIEQRAVDRHASASGYRDAFSIEFVTDNGSRVLHGAVHADGRGRIVGIDNYSVNILPEGRLLIWKNDDRPGVLFDITKHLAAAEVNIAGFEVGRHSGKEPPPPGHLLPDPTAPRTAGAAIGVVVLDDDVPPETLRAIDDLPHVGDVRYAVLPPWQTHVIVDDTPSPLFPDTRPGTRPESSHFGSGPTKKPPGWSVQSLRLALTGRSHRSKEGKARLAQAVDDTHRLLGLSDDYRVAIVPGSDTGAYEMAMWTMLGARGTDVAYWDAFGKGWYTDAVEQLRLSQVRELKAEYGWLPELDAVNFANDVCFTWNGTTSGVRVPNGDWIPSDRAGLTLCDATSAVFAMDLPWEKLDVTTFSWQKVLGGEGAHGMLILSPRAVERLESYSPQRPIPKVFRMTNSKGKLMEGLFRGETINTPSMLCVEDYLYALQWAESIGGLPALVRKSRSNLSAVEQWVSRTDWASFLARDPTTLSSTSICLQLDQAGPSELKAMTQALDAEGVASDIASYRDAPPGLRLWGGATVERDDLDALLPWITWAYDVALRGRDVGRK